MSLFANAHGLYVIVDPAQTRGRDPRAIAEAALAARPLALQLRDKHASDDALVPLARELRALCRAAAVPFVMNDRADLARLVDADALHLGQDDLRPEDARRVVGAMPLGLSTHSLEQARDGVLAGADHLGYGPVFGTASKANPDPTVGVESLRIVANSITIPWIAIGGITLKRIAPIRAAGARIAAVIGAVGLADDPFEAARALSDALRLD